MKLVRLFASILTLAAISLTAVAQEHDNSAYLSTFRADFDDSSGKLGQLADAIPEELYSWRPAEGVRSVSEVFMHVAGANLGLIRALGHDMQVDFPENAEKTVTSKEDVMRLLAESQEHVRMTLDMLNSADLAGMVQAFGSDRSRYEVLFILSGHSHEHLGQMIAYARSNSIAPPWSGG